jgi:hypothetical protein
MPKEKLTKRPLDEMGDEMTVDQRYFFDFGFGAEVAKDSSGFQICRL